MTPTEYRNSSQEKNSKTNIYQPKSNSKSTLLLFYFHTLSFYNQTNTYPYSQKLKHQEKLPEQNGNITFKSMNRQNINEINKLNHKTTN